MASPRSQKMPAWKRPQSLLSPAHASLCLVAWLLVLASGDPTAAQDTEACSPEFQGQALELQHCVVLDSLGDYSLAWSLPSKSRRLQFWFQGRAEVPYTWAGWGVSPSGGMIGSQVVVGYANPRQTDLARAEPFLLVGRSPTTFRRNKTEGPLRPNRKSLELEWLEGGRVVRIVGNATLTKRAPVWVIWRGGQAVLDYELGVLGPHMNTSKETRSIDFATGDVSDIEVWKPKDSLSSSSAEVPAAAVNKNCKYVVANKTEVFARCTTLDSDGKFSLAWTADNATGVVRFRYVGTPEVANGWVGWGVSPDGGRMTGSDVVVGYVGNDTFPTRARPYHLGGTDPEYFQVDNTTGTFQVVNGSLQVNFVSGGARAEIVGNATGLLAGPVVVIWRGGPGMLDLEKGLPSPHSSFVKARRTISFATGNVSTEDTSPLPPAPPEPAAGTRAWPLLQSLLFLVLGVHALFL